MAPFQAELPPPQPNRRRWLMPAVAALLVLLVIAATWSVARRVYTDDATVNAVSSTPTSSSPSAPPPSSSPVTTFAAPQPSPNRPPQANCPPACTQIPDSAWIDAAAIPLYHYYRWAPLAPLSEPVSNGRFVADEMCGAGMRSIDERKGALAARVVLPNPPGQWQLQVQIFHWRGDPWLAGQSASTVMDAAGALLREHCSFNSPGVSVSRIAEQNVPGGNPGQSLTATITEIGASPLVARIYLISDLRNSTVVELAMTSTSPTAVEWPAIDDEQVLAAMVAPLCTAYVDSCVR